MANINKDSYYKILRNTCKIKYNDWRDDPVVGEPKQLRWKSWI